MMVCVLYVASDTIPVRPDPTYSQYTVLTLILTITRAPVSHSEDKPRMLHL